MPSTLWRHLFRRPRPASRSASRKATPSHNAVRPCLECLEDRVAPTVVPVIVSGLTVSNQGYGGFAITSLNFLYGLTQHETLTAQVVSPVGPVNAGTVTFTDNGQSQTVPVSHSQASATFTFNVFPQFQANPNAHDVKATYQGAPVPGSPGSVFGSDTSGLMVTAGATTQSLLAAVLYEAFFLAYVLGPQSFPGLGLPGQ